MKYIESKYVGYDGLRMFMAQWIPDSERPRALIIVIHGLGSHGGDMRAIGEYFAERNFAVFAPDMRGFGHYSGLKGHIMKYEEFIEDLQNIVMQVKDQFPNRITYLYGSSLGGLHIIWYVVTYPGVVDGIILSCPAVAQSLKISKAKYIAGYILSLMNVKKYYENDVTLEDACRDPEVIERQKRDPLRFERVTPRFGIECLKAVSKGFQLGPYITLPVLYQQAGDDKLVPPARSKEFYETIASKDKSWILYPGLYHALHDEPEREQVFNDIQNWLDKRLPT